MLTPFLHSLLLEAGATSTLDVKTALGVLPLELAIQYGNSAVFELLLESHAEPHRAANGICNVEYGWCPIHVAAAFNKVDIVSFLIRVYAVDITTLDLSGNSPLDIAETHGSGPVINILKNQYGATYSGQL